MPSGLQRAKISSNVAAASFTCNKQDGVSRDALHTSKMWCDVLLGDSAMFYKKVVWLGNVLVGSVVPICKAPR